MNTGFEFHSLFGVGAFGGLAILSLGMATAALGREPDRTDLPVAPHLTTGEPVDPYLWLEDVSGEKALNWVRQQNSTSQKELESLPDFEATRKRILAILDSKEKIPYVSKHGAWYYNFWRDEKSVRGIWRRTTLPEFKKSKPA